MTPPRKNSDVTTDNLAATRVVEENGIVRVNSRLCATESSDISACRYNCATVMSVQKGAQVGPYRVDDRIGVGGMGEVYAATDTRLQRRVAIKILPPSLAKDPQRRARLQREAELISSLHHPHVCRLYDVGETEDGGQYLVLELLEGDTLQARLRKGPLPPAQVLRIASQMADALAAAHRHRIVHRDLKPGNVMLTVDGAKLLDFGLAKPVVASPASAETIVTDDAPTGEGTLTGTLHYMAPEQVQGGLVDARTDIFAFGAVLHEMATAEKAFEGANTASVIARILDHDPPPISRKVAHAPAALDDLVATCLAKDPEQRWQSAHDVHLQLERLRRQEPNRDATRGDGNARARSRWTWLPWTAAAALAVLSGSLLFSRQARPSAAGPRMRFELPVDAQLGGLDAPELSPDGLRLAYAGTKDGRRSLFVRDLSALASRNIAGTVGATFPFWAPDGKSIGFFADGSLKRVALTGGVTQTLSQVSAIAGGVWGPGFILFFPSPTSILHRISERGGAAERLDVPAEAARDAMPPAFARPSLLSDGDHYLTLLRGAQSIHIYLGSFSGRTLRKLHEVGSPWAQVAAGHLVYVHGRRLLARSFDTRTLEFTGAERVLADPAGAMSVVDSGTIAYREPQPVRRLLTWVDRNGRVDGGVGEAGNHLGVTMSSLGRDAAVWSRDDDGNRDIWRLTIATGILERLTTHPAADTDPAWSPDGRRLAFTSERLGVQGIFVKDLTTGEETLLHHGDEAMVVDTWTPDGRYVIARTLGRAVFAIPVDGDRKARMLVDTPYAEDELHISPDGTWVAYNSDESGVWQVYIARFPSFADKRQISRDGGVQPLWGVDGRELFYLSPDASVMSVRMEGGPTLTPSQAVRLFGTNVEPTSQLPQYAVTPDGQRFLLLDRGPRRPDKIHVLVNWIRPEGQ